MHARVVEHLPALRHAQKACALFKRLRPQLWDLLDLRARGERAVFLTVGDDVFGCRRVQARDLPQQRSGSRIEVHADCVDARLDHAAERRVELLLRHVVLILADADGLRVDLHELGQRVLQPPRDRHGRAQIHVVLREFLRRQLRSGIDRRTRLIDDHIRHAAAQPADHLDGHRLRLARGGTVADGKMAHVVLFDELRELRDGVLLLLFAEGGIDDRGVEHLARLVDDRDLAAVAVAGVEAHRDRALDRRLHEQRAEVERKVVDGLLVGRVSQGGAQLALHAGLQQPVIAVVADSLHEVHRGAPGLYHAAADALQRLVAVDRQADLQRALALAAVEGQDLMALQAGDGLREIKILPVDGGLLVLLLCRGRLRRAAAVHERTQALAHLRVVGDALGEDVGRAGQRIFQRPDALVRVDIRRGQRLGRVHAQRLGKDSVRQRLEALFPGDRRARAALGLVGAVEVLDLRERRGLVDGLCQLVRQLFLRGDGGLDLLAPLGEIAQILQPRLKRAERRVVHGAVLLLAVAGDEGNGVALVKKGDDICDIFLSAVEFLRQKFGNGLHEGAPFQKLFVL